MNYQFLNGINQDFIDYCITLNATVCDLGCGYGFVSNIILEQTNCNVYAIDSSAEHLLKLTEVSNLSTLYRLVTVKLCFPQQYQYADNFFSAIHSSQFLHFLRGKELLLGLKKIFNSLKPGGKFFLNTTSIYIYYLEDFVSIYEDRQDKQIPWPGEIENYLDYVSDTSVTYNQNFFHVHDIPSLRKICKRLKNPILEKEN